MDGDNQGFLGRWSRRKSAARTDRPRDEAAGGDGGAHAGRPDPGPDSAAHGTAPGRPAQAPDLHSRAHAADGQPAQRAAAPAAVPFDATAETDAPPLPTRDDLAALTHDSDFSPFMQQAVEPDVKLAALKKLFSDPHYNVMDGLDVYIDDYSSPEKLPDSTLRQMVSARVLALVQDDPPAGGPAPAPAGESGTAAPDVAADAEGSMLESDASTDRPADDGQTHFDFPEPDRHG